MTKPAAAGPRFTAEGSYRCRVNRVFFNCWIRNRFLLKLLLPPPPLLLLLLLLARGRLSRGNGGWQGRTSASRGTCSG
jgi:hypothetical protein